MCFGKIFPILCCSLILSCSLHILLILTEKFIQNQIMQQGSCHNPFEGCTPYVDCPYYYNPSGKCDSSPEIHPGVFTVFWDAYSCCRANFPSELSKCVAAAVETSEPTLAPTSVAPVAVSKQLVSIPPIPITLLVNLTSPMQLEADQTSMLEAIIINSTANEVESELNATIQSMKLSTRKSHEEGDVQLSFEIHPIVIINADMSYSVQDMRASMLKILNNQNSNIALHIEELFGKDINLLIPSIQSNDGVDDSNNLLTAVLASTLSAISILICVGGLIIRQRGKRKNKLLTMQDVAVADNQIVTVVDDPAVGSTLPHQIADDASPSFRAHETDDGYDGGNSTYNMNTAFNESDFSLPTIASSAGEGDSVLGLLYYEGGPDSSESEEDGHQSRAASRASRRSRRSSRSKKSEQTSADPRKSRRSATKTSRRSSRQISLEKVDEGTEYRRNKSKKPDPDGFDGSTITSASQSRQGSAIIYRGGSFAPTNASSIADADDSLIFDTYPPMRPPAGVESVASSAHAPSIVTKHSAK